MRVFSEAERAELWDLYEKGVSERQIAVRMGRNEGSVRQFLIDNAGRRPRSPGSSKLRLVAC
jgi:IS30 family transposase